MLRKYLLLLSLMIIVTFSPACSPREKSQPVQNPTQPLQSDLQGPKTTVLLDSDNHSKIVLTIDGWQDYHPGDVISAQGDSTAGGGHDWEVVRGWFIVKPSTKQLGFWEPYLVRMYYVRTLTLQRSNTSATISP